MNSIVKKALIFVVAAIVVAGGARIGRTAYKRATGAKLLAQASQCLGCRDFTNAALCLQRVLQLEPLSAEGSKLTADMLEATESPAALGWRIRAFQLHTNNAEYRLAWAETALRTHDSRSAAQALSGVEEREKSSAAYHKLAGALAWELKDAVLAEKEYLEALRLEPANQALALNLATIRLASTNDAQANAARLSLEQTQAGSPLRFTALRLLIADAAAHKALARAAGYSQSVVSSPEATYADKLTHLELLRESGGGAYKGWRDGLEEEARGSGAHAFELGRWMAVGEGPTNALHWLRTLPANVQTNLPMPLVLADCQIALKDWHGLAANVAKRDWGDLEYYRCALESLAGRNLQQAPSAGIAWQKAVHLAAQRLDCLTRLNQLALAWGWNAESIEILKAVIAKFPREQWAADELVAALYTAGDTREIIDVLRRVHSANPADDRIKNNLAMISLLRKVDMENAHKLAREAYDGSPNNPFFICTYAYSLLLQKKPEAAVKVLNGLQTEHSEVSRHRGVLRRGAGGGRPRGCREGTAQTGQRLQVVAGRKGNGAPGDDPAIGGGAGAKFYTALSGGANTWRTVRRMMEQSSDEGTSIPDNKCRSRPAPRCPPRCGFPPAGRGLAPSR